MTHSFTDLKDQGVDAGERRETTVHSLEFSNDEDGRSFHDLTGDGRGMCNKMADSQRLSFDD